MKKLISFFLLLYIFLPFANANNRDDLNALGRALANYKICAQIANNIDDQVMYHYYYEMFNDSVITMRFYPLNQSEIVFKAFYASIDKLLKIDKESLAKLCSSRLDSLSRSMQEIKLTKNKS